MDCLLVQFVERTIFKRIVVSLCQNNIFCTSNVRSVVRSVRSVVSGHNWTSVLEVNEDLRAEGSATARQMQYYAAIIIPFHASLYCRVQPLGPCLSTPWATCFQLRASFLLCLKWLLQWVVSPVLCLAWASRSRALFHSRCQLVLQIMLEDAAACAVPSPPSTPPVAPRSPDTTVFAHHTPPRKPAFWRFNTPFSAEVHVRSIS